MKRKALIWNSAALALTAALILSSCSQPSLPESSAPSSNITQPAFSESSGSYSNNGSITQTTVPEPSTSSNSTTQPTSPINPGNNPYNVIVSPKRDNNPKWVYGAEGQDGTKQGVDNWYYMYTEETNTDGLYDISKIKECWYSEVDGGGSCISSSHGKGKLTWVASIYDKDSDIWETNNWWDQSMGSYSMDLNPAVTKGPYASAVLAFKAPEDGVTVSVYGHTKRLYCRSIRYDVMEGEILCINAMLKAGDYAYIIVDPNTNGNDDSCRSLKAEVTHTLSAYVDNESAWGFGKSFLNGDGTKQGVNNWYYMYSEETGTDGLYDTNGFRECLYKQVASTDPCTGKTSGTWVPDIYDNNTEIYTSGGNWWRQDAFGQICPSVHTAPYASAILAWKAPAQGVYTIDLQMAVLNAAGDNGDGLTVSLYGGSKAIYSEKIENYRYFELHAEVDMEKDECFFIIVDPNESGESDLAEELDVFIQRQIAG